jgi:hypothetical protein
MASSYFSWYYCGLKEKLRDYILDYCCCGMGEYILCVMDFIGCVTETKENIEGVVDDEPVRRLTHKASRVVLDKVNDNYKNDNDTSLDIDVKVYDEDKIIEMINNENLYNITESGTPRRRKRVEI